MDPALRLGLGDSLDAVRASLVLEHRVGALALDGEDDLLVAAGLVRARREHLRLEAAALRVARQHAQQGARPQRSLVAADALPDLHQDVLPVGRIGLDERQPQLLLQACEPLLQLGHELPQVTVLPGRLEVVAHAAPLLRQLVRALELLQPPAHLGRLAMVVVDGRVGEPFLGLAVGAVELLDEVLQRAHFPKGSEPGRIP